LIALLVVFLYNLKMFFKKKCKTLYYKEAKGLTNAS